MESPLLQYLVLLPLLGAAAAAMRAQDDDRAIRRLALITTGLTFLLALTIAGQFDWSQPGQVQVLSQIEWVRRFGLSFGFGVDSISLWLVLLTAFLMPIVVLGSWTGVTKRVREFFIWLLVLEAAMLGTFIATDVIFFYICFEFTLVPLYFLIGIWGSKDRLRAAKVFFLYTFTGSMLTFAGVLFVAYFNASLGAEAIEAIRQTGAAELGVTLRHLPDSFAQLGEWSFRIDTLTLAAQRMSGAQQGWVLAALLAGFAVKVPLWPLHTWLPLAHTEAPTAGSVILAGVLLKLGTYGILRLALPMCPVAAVEAAPFIGTLAVIGILYAGLVCWVQKDIKKLIAYSSVSHLGFCVLGLFALGRNNIGPTGSVIYMLNHGLSTGALFLCVGMIYERFHTRQMRDYGGLARVMPVWTFFMVFFCLASVGLPGLNGFVGEFLTLAGAFTNYDVLGPAFAVPAGAGMIVAAIYILYMVGKVCFGPVKVPEAHHEAGEEQSDNASRLSGTRRDLNLREIVTLAPLALACLVLGLAPNLVLNSLDEPVTRLTADAKAYVFAQELDKYEPRPGEFELPAPPTPPQRANVFDPLLTPTNPNDVINLVPPNFRIRLRVDEPPEVTP